MEIKVKAFLLRTLFLGIWTAICWIMVITLLLGMIGMPSEIDSLWFLWLILIGVGIFMGNHVIWETLGKVRIEFSNKNMMLKNVNNLVKKEINIPIEYIKSIEYRKEDKIFPFSAWGFVQGDILIKYKNGERRIGKGLNISESKLIIKALNRKMTQAFKL